MKSRDATPRSPAPKPRHETGVTSMGHACRWRTARRNSRCCGVWPPLRHTWPRFARVARAWLVGQGCRDMASGGPEAEKPAAGEPGGRKGARVSVTC